MSFHIFQLHQLSSLLRFVLIVLYVVSIDYSTSSYIMVHIRSPGKKNCIAAPTLLKNIYVCICNTTSITHKKIFMSYSYYVCISVDCEAEGLTVK